MENTLKTENKAHTSEKRVLRCSEKLTSNDMPENYQYILSSEEILTQKEGVKNPLLISYQYTVPVDDRFCLVPKNICATLGPDGPLPHCETIRGYRWLPKLPLLLSSAATLGYPSVLCSICALIAGWWCLKRGPSKKRQHLSGSNDDPTQNGLKLTSYSSNDSRETPGSTHRKRGDSNTSTIDSISAAQPDQPPPGTIPDLYVLTASTSTPHDTTQAGQDSPVPNLTRDAPRTGDADDRFCLVPKNICATLGPDGPLPHCETIRGYRWLPKLPLLLSSAATLGYPSVLCSICALIAGWWCLKRGPSKKRQHLSGSNDDPTQNGLKLTSYSSNDSRETPGSTHRKRGDSNTSTIDSISAAQPDQPPPGTIPDLYVLTASTSTPHDTTQAGQDSPVPNLARDAPRTGDADDRFCLVPKNICATLGPDGPLPHCETIRGYRWLPKLPLLLSSAATLGYPSVLCSICALIAGWWCLKRGPSKKRQHLSGSNDDPTQNGLKLTSYSSNDSRETPGSTHRKRGDSNTSTIDSISAAQPDQPPPGTIPDLYVLTASTSTPHDTTQAGQDSPVPNLARDAPRTGDAEEGDNAPLNLPGNSVTIGAVHSLVRNSFTNLRWTDVNVLRPILTQSARLIQWTRFHVLWPTLVNDIALSIGIGTQVVPPVLTASAGLVRRALTAPCARRLQINSHSPEDYTNMSPFSKINGSFQKLPSQGSTDSITTKDAYHIPSSQNRADSFTNVDTPDEAFPTVLPPVPPPVAPQPAATTQSSSDTVNSGAATPTPSAPQANNVQLNQNMAAMATDDSGQLEGGSPAAHQRDSLIMDLMQLLEEHGCEVL